MSRRRYSCTAQPLPSGSVKYMNVAPSSGAYRWGAETSTPRATSSAWAASMSVTQSWSPWYVPGCGSPVGLGTPSVRAIEQPEPGGVSWTTRAPGITSPSMSRWKPSLSR